LPVDRMMGRIAGADAELPDQTRNTEAALEPRDRIIVALDVDGAEAAVALARSVGRYVGAVKVGLELVHAAGLDIFDRLHDAGIPRIFYDCKLHDIPNTVAGAARAIAKRRVWMMNVHASGGSRMVQSAAVALRDAVHGDHPPLLVAVTLLTSLSVEELYRELRVGLTPENYVVDLARMARTAGARGVVASPQEVRAIRDACGPEFLIVTPGIRPTGTESGDQRRTATPGDAIRSGATYLVVGRPITAAPDPVGAAQSVLAEVEAACASLPGR
jgi:orotidine-5'-phosphate decarboxylase